MGKTFLISGCASGIGKHMALALARAPEQHNLMLIDLDGAALERVVAEHGLANVKRVMTRQHDVRDAAGWERVVAAMVERFGALDVMLNIAGYLKPGYIDAQSPDELDRHIDVNVKGVMYATRIGAQQMKRQGRGHIVNIASLAGIGHVPGLSAYCASKHAVRGFSLAVAHELARHGIAVSVVCPDAVETPMLDLQVSYDEAAMTFGGGRGLSLEEVEHALMNVLEHRPLEVLLPVPGSGRAVLSKLANAFPALTKLGLRRTLAQGRKAQVARKPMTR
jgi:NAD(P)-dependent dehydrogenase (short-subunit alcohol dehydrogenase family)